MEHAKQFVVKFDTGYYNNFLMPEDAAQCQRMIEEFMTLVEQNALIGSQGAQIMKQFCTFVQTEDVWHLADMVVPQFRQSRSENEIDQAEEKGDFTCLNYMLDNLTRLPVRNDRHVLTTEQDLVRERYESYVRYIMSGGTCETDLGFEEEKEVDDLLGHLTDIARVHTEENKSQASKGNSKPKKQQRSKGDVGGEIDVGRSKAIGE